MILNNVLIYIVDGTPHRNMIVNSSKKHLFDVVTYYNINLKNTVNIIENQSEKLIQDVFSMY